ncbi:uncharacterized protein LOC136030262 [Artemia franciscana]|uniref:uncharacterized protein LOC136030262 n=1 Tax=Artemia franciscana TaxID=6661 RepID=UPI0032DA21E7
MEFKVFVLLSLFAVAFASEEAAKEEGKYGEPAFNVYPASYDYGIQADYKYRNDYANVPYYCPAIHKCFDGYQLRKLYISCPVLYRFDCSRGKGYHGRPGERPVKKYV